MKSYHFLHKKEVLDFESHLNGKVVHYQSHFGAPILEKPHIHTELEVNLITSGEGTYLISGKEFQLEKGTLIWLHPNNPHFLIRETEDFKMDIYLFKTELLECAVKDGAPSFILDLFKINEISFELTEDWYQKILLHGEGIIEDSASPFMFNMSLSYLLAMLIEVSEHSEQNKGVGIDDEILDAIKTLNDDPLVTLNILSDKYKMSSSQLSRKFSKQVGLRISEYRNNIQIMKFMNLWHENKQENIMNLMYKAGFGSYPQFFRVFNNHYKMSPADYKSKNF